MTVADEGLIAEVRRWRVRLATRLAWSPAEGAGITGTLLIGGMIPLSPIGISLASGTTLRTA